jgi:hypothetical protein
MAKSKSEAIDWSHWARLREVKVYEALALLDGQEPPENCPDADDESTAYRKRMRLLLDALSKRERFGPRTLNLSDPLLHGVDLAEVGRWAKANGYPLPDKFPCAVPRADAIRANTTGCSVIRWNLWTSVPHMPLWEAVALVLNIEPSSLKRSRQEWMAGPGGGPIFESRSFPSATSRDDFNTALSFAERAANAAGPIHLRAELAVGMNKRTALVSLREVVAFLAGCGLEGIPAPLLSLASNSGQAASVAAEPVVQAEASPPLAGDSGLSTGYGLLTDDAKEDRRKEMLQRFRELDGRRPSERGSGKPKGTRGALTRLSEETGMHTKNLGELLDKAIKEKATSDRWSELVRR